MCAYPDLEAFSLSIYHSMPGIIRILDLPDHVYTRSKNDPQNIETIILIATFSSFSQVCSSSLLSRKNYPMDVSNQIKKLPFAPFSVEAQEVVRAMGTDFSLGL